MCLATCVLPQQEKTPVESRHSKSLPKTIGGDIGRVIASPLHLSKREGLQLAAFIAISAGLYTFLDDPIDEEYAREGHHSIFWPAKEMAEIGKLYDNIKPVNKEFQSLPSGHASSIFAIATVISKQYDHWWVKIPAYTFATSVAFQRMNDRRHWGSDVFVGGGIGYWVASKLVNKKPGQSTGSLFHPYFAGNAAGMVVSF
jgi:hypothetical protein